MSEGNGTDARFPSKVRQFVGCENALLVVCNQELYPSKSVGGTANTNGIVKAHLKHVMERRGTEWRILAAQNTFYSGSPPAR